jgi:hypothetical protein
MLTMLFGAMLLAHGLVHLAWFAPEQPDDAYPFRWDSMLFPNASETTLRRIGTPAIVALVVALTLAALGVWGVPVLSTVWVPLAVVGALISTALMVTLWHRWFVTGPAVNALIVGFALFGLFR